MAYIGNTQERQTIYSTIDYFNGDGSTSSFTLSRSVNSAFELDVVVNNVPQNPGAAYSVNGNVLTFTSAPTAGSGNIYVKYNTATVASTTALVQGAVFTGDLNLSGSGIRIKGDFSNTTLANRVLFQSNVPNLNTGIIAIPNGTSVISSFNAFNSSDPSNASGAQVITLPGQVAFRSERWGTGTYLPMTFHTGGSERMHIDTSGNVGIGTGNVGIGTSIPSNALTISKASGHAIIRLNDTTSSVDTYFISDSVGTTLAQTSALPMLFKTFNTERMRIDANGNVGIGTGPIAKLHVLSTGEYTGSINPRTGLHLQATNITGGYANTRIQFSYDYNNPKSYIEAGVYGADYLAFGNGSGTAEAMRIDISGNVLITSNDFYQYQPAQTTKSAAATLTGAELMTLLLQYTGAAATVTLPTGTNIDAAVSSSLGVNGCFDWWVINTGSGVCTIAANGNTTVGALTVTNGTSAQFRFRKTAANTYTVYRLG